MDELTQAVQALERRRLRMKSAGQLFPPAVAAAMEHIGRAPRLAGHDGVEQMCAAVEEFLRERQRLSLVLSAPTGRGKSFLATWAVAETMERSVWLPASEVRVGESWEALRLRAAKAGLLVVDDLGEEGSGEWGVREVASLLEGRHNAGRRTLVTTNLMPTALGTRYGDRLLSRWCQEGLSQVLCVRGSDLRRSISASR